MTQLNAVNPESKLVPAVKANDLKAVQLALKSGEDPNQTQKLHFTCFQYACNFSSAEIVQSLLDAGGEIESRETWLGRTPIILAVNGSKPETVKMLIDKGADVNAKTQDGSSVLYYAKHRLALTMSKDSSVEHEHSNAQRIVEMLEKAGAE